MLAALLALAAGCSDNDRDTLAGVVAPQTSGVARYIDADFDDAVGAGDVLVVSFDQDVDVSPGADASAFDLPVQGDTLGAGVVVTAGPAPNEVTVTLGAGAVLRIPGTFSGGAVGAGAPSGIDVASDLNDSIEDADTGVDADRSTPVDIVPALADSGQRLGTATSLTVVAGDVDGDGDPDLVFGTTDGAALWTNDGTGAFADSGQDLGSGTVRAVVLADLDGDTDLDLALGVDGGANRVYLNAAGVFTNTLQSLGANATRALAAADLDLDGDLDLYEGNGTDTGAGTPNRVWINNGLATFSDAGAALGTADTYAVLAFDADGDLDPDVIELNHFDMPDRVLRNEGGITFADTSQDLSRSRARGGAVADLDGDGDLDFVEANGVVGTEQPSRVWIGNGLGDFATGPDFGFTATAAVALADFDGDGDPDLLEANTGQPSILFLNTGTGTFVDVRQRIAAGSTLGVVIADVDGDGDLDAVFANGAGEPDQVWLGSNVD